MACRGRQARAAVGVVLVVVLSCVSLDGSNLETNRALGASSTAQKKAAAQPASSVAAPPAAAPRRFDTRYTRRPELKYKAFKVHDATNVAATPRRRGGKTIRRMKRNATFMNELPASKIKMSGKSNHRDIHGNPIEMSFTDPDLSDMSTTEYNKLHDWTTSDDFGPLPDDEKQRVFKMMEDKTLFMEHLFKVNTFQRDKIFAVLPEKVRDKVKTEFRREWIRYRHAERTSNHGTVPRHKRLFDWKEVKELMEYRGQRTAALDRHLIGAGRTLCPRDKYLDACGLDLLARKTDSDAELERKRIARDDVRKRGILEDTLKIDLKQMRKEKVKKQLGAKTEREYRVKLKARTILGRTQRRILTKGQRGMADRHVATERPKHLFVGKSKPWKQTRGRGNFRRG